jgi:cell division protein FtsW
MGLGLSGVVAMIAYKPYRLKRITAFIDPFADPLGTGYQVVQSLYAIGSGWLFGVGLGASRQKLLYLPERHTDFIFSIIGEELGFVGAAFVILLFAMFIWRGFYIAVHLDDKFKSLTAFGLTAVIGIQALINIGVAVGAMPVTGITLPFISYGGTSLSFMLATVGFLLNMSRYMRR